MTGNQRSSVLRRSRRLRAAGHGGAVLAVVGAISASTVLAWLPADVASASTAPGHRPQVVRGGRFLREPLRGRFGSKFFARYFMRTSARRPP
jgi:hypothetical protein